MSNTSRIAKNTLALYFRQIITMLVSLYTVRVKFEILGVEDYGIFNIVSGVVILFTFLNGAMASATQRFLNFALGRNDAEKARNVYSASLVFHALIAVLVIILAQTVGLWFFNNRLNIPPERQGAAFIVYQFSVVATVMGILQVPYRATIFAYEKMSFFAMLSIVESALRLGIVFLLPVILLDKLVVYAFLMCIAGLIILLIHKVYCNKTFEIAHFRYFRDKELLRQLLQFSGWTTFSGVASIGRVQGTNILLNIFHGVMLNAAMGIAMQVHAAVHQFVSNFQTAFKPQIVKSYSASNYDYFMRLIFRTSKISFYLLLFFVLPLYINMGFILQIWLNNVPEYAVTFTQLLLLFSLINAIIAPLWMSIQATGDIKKYQIISGSLVLANLPLSLLVLWMAFNPVWVLVIRLGLEIIILVWLIFFLGGKIKLPVLIFFCRVIIPVILITGGAGFMTIFLRSFFLSDWNRLIVSCVISALSIGGLIYWVGLDKQERGLLRNFVKTKIDSIKQRKAT